MLGVMGKTLIAAIIIAIVLAGWASHHHGSSPAPAPASSHASTTSTSGAGSVHPVGNQVVHESGPDGDVSATCQPDGTPTDVHPDTAAARTRARSLCASANADAQAVANQLNAVDK